MRHPLSVSSNKLTRAFLASAGALLICASTSAASLPTGGKVESGAATISQSANALNVHQTTQKLQLGWDSFNVSQGATVNFQQPSSSSLAVNMVRGGDASLIAGAINANGRVVLVNPQGIAFTGTAQVNVGSLIASALRDVSGDFSSGRTELSGLGGEVSNAGSITIANGGHAVLAGSRVTNNGLIVADAGKVALAAGSKVSLDYAGDGLLTLSVDAGAVDAAVTNGGAIRVGSGHVLLTAKAAGDLANSVVSNLGTVAANGIVERGGEIWITADTVQNSGTVSATSAQGQGGTAYLRGAKSASVTGTVDVSGATQGGFVDVSAPAVHLADLALIKVGRGGTFLLDPDNITINAGGSPIVGDPTNSSSVTDIVLSSLSIQNWLATGANLSINAANAGSITVAASITVNAANAGNLSLNADAGFIDIQQPISTTGGLSVFSNSGDVYVSATINAAFVSLAAGGDLWLGSNITTTNGDLGFATLGDLYVDGNLTFISTGDIYTQVDGRVLTNISEVFGGSYFEMYRFDTELAAAGWLISEDTAGASFFGLAGSVSMQYGFGSGFKLPTAENLAFVAEGQIKYPDPYLNQAPAPVTGYVRGDVQADVFDAPNLALTWTSGAPTSSSAAGSTFDYQLSRGTGFTINRPGYVFVAADADTGTLTVRPRELLVKPDDLSGTYGTFTKPAKYLYQITGFQNGDTNTSLGITGEASVSCTYDQAVAANRGAGDYTIAISQNTLVKGGDLAGNYALKLNLQPGTLAIAKAPLTITADDKSRDYGDANPTFTASGAGFVYGDTLATALTGNLSLTTSANLTSNVGQYAIVLTQGTADSANYDVTQLVNGTLTINKAALAITMRDATKVYGDALAAGYAYDMTGFKNGETEAGLRTAGTLSGTVLFTTSATQSSGVGTYTLEPLSTNLTALNYKFTPLNPGILTITPRGLIVSASPVREYGLDNDPTNVTWNTVITGWAPVNGDSQALVTGEPAIIGAPGAGANAGFYFVNLAKGTLSAGPNYTFDSPPTTYNGAFFTVSKATSLRFVAENKTREYGDANPALTWTVSGFRNGDTAAVLGGSPSLNTVANAFSNVGNYTINISQGTLTAANYTVNLPVNFVNGILAVTKATLQVTAVSTSRPYGDPNPAFTAVVTGFKNGQSLGTSGVSGNPSLTTDATVLSPVGSYVITTGIGTLAAGNYAFDLYDGTLTITKAPLTVTANNSSRAYGTDNSPGFSGYTITGFKNGETEAGLRNIGDLTGEPAMTTDAVSSSVVATNAHGIIITKGTLDATNYDFDLSSYQNGVLDITKALLTVTASDKSRLYGDANPALEYTLSGFNLGETTLGEISATGLPLLATVVGPTTNVGAYAVTVDISGLSSPNYDFAKLDGTLTITKAPLALRVNDATSEYGSDFSGFSLTMTGFKNGETQSGLRTAGALSGDASYTYTNAEVKSLNVNGSPYTVNVSGLNTLDATNYSFSLPATTGALTITKAPITLTATQIQRTYGDAWTQTQVDNQWDIVGLKNGQTRDGLIGSGAVTGAASVTSAQAVDSLTGAGTYTGAVTATNGSFAVSLTGNYSFDIASSPTAASLIIDKANVVVGVSGTPLTKLYGAAVPALTPSYTGLKNGQNAGTAGISGSAVLATTATSASNVGSYTVTVDVSGMSAANYTFTSTNGVLNITQAPLTVTADSKTREYGLNNPTLTATITGYVLGQNLGNSGVTGSASLSTTALPSSNIGNYPITVTQGTLASSNYSFSFVDSTLTITRAPLTISADPKSKIYGDANPALTYSVLGLRQSDTDAVILGGTPTLSTAINELTGAGVYGGAILVDTTGLSAANYTINRSSGTFTVLKATLLGTVDNTTRYYGYPNPAFTVTWTGYRNGDTAATAGFTGALAFTTEANPASPVAGSPFVVSAATGTYSSANYEFGAITPGLITIERGNLWENDLYNLAAAPLSSAIRLDDIQARLRGQPLFQDPQARLNFDKYPFRLDLDLKGDAKRKKDEADKATSGSISKN